MAETLKLPDLGEGLQEAEIVAWHVGVGDHVSQDQPVVSVETDKAVTEIPSPYSGHVTALHGRPGDVVRVGTPLMDFTLGEVPDPGTVVGLLQITDAKAPPSPTKATAIVKATPAVRALAKELGVDLSTVPASGPGGTITRTDVEAASKVSNAAKVEQVRGFRRAS